MEWACHNLGGLYADQGKLVEAQQMYQRALQGFEKAWGPEHTSTLDTVNNLGLLYYSQGKLAEAEQMYQRALQGFENPEHTSTLTTVHNLGLLYANQGKLVEAAVGAHVPGEKDVRPWVTQRRLFSHAARCSYFFANGLFAEKGME
jgi:Tfp pilus assembly protein PilF